MNRLAATRSGLPELEQSHGDARYRGSGDALPLA
jgi:hypothetical protein